MMTKGERLPFDNAQMRTIFYSRANPREHQAAVADLRAAAAAVIAARVQDPVTHALGVLKLGQGDDKERVIATVSAQVATHDAELSELRTTLNTLLKSVASTSSAGSSGFSPPRMASTGVSEFATGLLPIELSPEHVGVVSVENTIPPSWFHATKR